MARKPSKTRSISVYSNLAHKRRTKKDAEARKKAEYLASLPKHPVKRVLYRLHPKRLAAFWFSKRGAITALKVLGVGILIMLLSVGALFAYFRKDLDAIRPGELAKRVQTTVTRYEDRNGNLLWEDKGNGNYKLVVNGNDINQYMKQATVAIEDRNFYKHGGISFSGIVRSAVNNVNGGDTQGGSTLTQQLVKQVFFADQAQARGIGGIPRKIKEMILSVEVERMYSKDKILDLYLNESPYGGRRNGVESASQTYFGKSAKDLTLPEAALLAGIPNQPGLYDPYNVAGHDALIARQHKVLDNMAQQGYITQQQADDAKKFPILDSIKPLSDQYKNIKAPHFVQMVRSQLETELGKATVGKGGLIIKTTLDLRIQNRLEQSMTNLFNSSMPRYAGFTDGAATVEDSKTGQIIAMMGSRAFDYPGFGQDNAALSFIQPGSTIKPLVYAKLFSNQGSNKQNYGSGSVLADDNTMSGIYGAPLSNADRKFMGNITVRKALALSRNIPAVKAMYITGVQPARELIHALGDTSYCTQGSDAQAGLSSAIGGCTNRQIDLVNAYASLADMGKYKPVSTVLDVTNSQGQILKKYQPQSKQIIDPQVAYILADILSDDNARAGLYGPRFPGLYIPGVKTAVKTGTSDSGGKPKDIWNISYSPALTMGVWLGNPDTRVLTNGNSSIPARIIGDVMAYAHQDIYAKEGKWKTGDWYSVPTGIQNINGELYPSWYKPNQSQTGTTMTFDKISKKLATSCTPAAAKIDITVTKSQDPVTKKDTVTAPDGYDPNTQDDVHKCTDTKPTVDNISVAGNTITVTVSAGSHPLQSLDIIVNGKTIKTLQVTASGNYTADYQFDNSTQTVAATVTDSVLYTGTASTTVTPASAQNNPGPQPVKPQKFKAPHGD